MTINKSDVPNRQTDINLNTKSPEHYKGDQPIPADPKPGTEKPEVEVPDFDKDGTVTKSDLVTVESKEINDDKTE